MTNYGHWELQQDTHDRCTHEFDNLVAGQLGFPVHPCHWSPTTEKDVLKSYTDWLQQSAELLTTDDAKDGKYLRRLLDSAMAADNAMAFHEEVETVTDRLKDRKHLRLILQELQGRIGELPPCPPCRIETIQLETPVMAGRNFKVGNVDVLVAYRVPQLIAPDILLPLFPKEISVNMTMLFEVVWSSLSYVEFECKTVIYDPGELFRQLYDHQRGLPKPLKQFVVSPDKHYAELIRQQGFGFIVYEPLDREEPVNFPQMDFNFNDL